MKTIVKFFFVLGSTAVLSCSVLGCGSGSSWDGKPNGNRISTELIDSDSVGATDSAVAYSYDDFGQLIQEKYNAGYHAKTETHLDFYYDDTGLLTEEMLEDAEGNLVQHTQYDYDDSCFDRGLDSVNESGYNTETITVQCDEDGNIMQRQFDYDADQIVDEVVEYTIDEYGHVTSETHYDQNGEEIEWLYRSYQTDYDGDGNLLSRIAYSDEDKILFESSYAYINGNLRTRHLDEYTEGEYETSSEINYIYE